MGEKTQGMTLRELATTIESAPEGASVIVIVSAPHRSLIVHSGFPLDGIAGEVWEGVYDRDQPVAEQGASEVVG